MKKIFLLVFLLVLLIGISACDGKSEVKAPENNDDDNNEDVQLNDDSDDEYSEEESDDEGIIKGSLNKLMELGKSIKCELEYVDEEGTVDQITYVSGEKFNSETSMTIEGEHIIMNSISDGTWLYMWSDMTPGQGTKIKFEDFMDDALEAGQDYESAQVDLEEEHDFKCVPWVPVNSKFVPPNNIDFKDMGEMIKGLEDLGNSLENGGASDMCAICEFIPDEDEKADCMANC